MPSTLSQTTISLPEPLRIIDPREPSLAKTDGNVAIAVTDCEPPTAVLSYFIDHGLRQIVQRSNQEFKKEIGLSIIMLQEARNFLDYPLSAVLNPKRIGVDCEIELQDFSAPFASNCEKAGVVANACEALKSFARPSLVLEISVVMDELISNAIYHASAGATVVDPQSGVRARHDIRSPKPGTLILGHDKGRVVVACRDLYGSLNPMKMLRRMHDCYANGDSCMSNWSGGGAGIGSFMIFNSCSSYYLGVEPGQQTLICCSFPLHGGAKYRQTLPKNLHLAISP